MESTRSNPDTPLWEGMPLVRLLDFFLVRWKRFVLAPVVVIVISLAFARLTRVYVASASFVADVEELPTGAIAGLASQFGVSLPTGGGTSNEFFAQLMKSRRILEKVVNAHYEFVDEDSVRHSGDYAALVGVEEATEAETLQEATARLQDAIETSVGAESGLIWLEVTTPWPDFSILIAENILAGVNDFNVAMRRSRSKEERLFVEDRLRAAREDLAESTERLSDFLETNRDRSAPELQLREEELRLDVSLDRQTVTSLAQAFEEARIAEVRNTPVMTVVDSPDRSAEPRPGVLMVVFGGAVAGCLLALASVVAEGFWQQQKEVDPGAVAALKRRLTVWRANRPRSES